MHAQSTKLQSAKLEEGYSNPWIVLNKAFSAGVAPSFALASAHVGKRYIFQLPQQIGAMNA
jgi:hypothetical protein